MLKNLFKRKNPPGVLYGDDAKRFYENMKIVEDKVFNKISEKDKQFDAQMDKRISNFNFINSISCRCGSCETKVNKNH